MISAILMAVLALFRPTEATAVFAAVGMLYRGSSRGPRGVFSCRSQSGLAIGWLPWVVEMSIRFGGPLNALDEAGSAPFIVVYRRGELPPVPGLHRRKDLQL